MIELFSANTPNGWKISIMLEEIGYQYKVTKNAENALDSIKPRIFWKDKPIFLRQMNKWNSEKLKKAKKLIIKTEITMKTKFNNYNSTLIRNLLISLYRIANSTS